MNALAPCPVCGRAVPVTTLGTLATHRQRYDAHSAAFRCPGSGALAPVADLFPDAPQTCAIPAAGVQESLPL